MTQVLLRNITINSSHGHQLIFDGASLDGSTLNEVEFDKCSFKNMKTIATIVRNTTFNYPTVENLTIKDCEFYGSSPTKDNVSGGSMSNVAMDNCIVEGINVKDMVINNCQLTNITCVKSVLNVKIEGEVVIRNSTFIKSDLTCLPKDIFKECTIIGCTPEDYNQN